jgi:poly-gamma-glutamate synthesis protein (capsule biosynthesis protein)
MKKKTKFWVVLALLILLGVLCWEFSKLAEMMKEEYQVVSSEVNPTESEEAWETLISSETIESETESTEPTEDEAVKETFQEIIETVELVAVGDNLIHEGLYKTGMNSSGEWNYDHVYANVAEEIQAADLAIINQETIFINDRNKISAYPMFGSPPEIGDSLVATGFDVVLHASNHTVDKGKQGVWDTINFWKEKHPEITVLGINESPEDQEEVDVVECNGIRFAMLNYTYGLNGLSMPADQPYLVNLLDKEKMTADIAKAKEISDMVVVFLHVGNEYVYQPSEASKQWVDFLLEQGVDIAINAHPHVLEPYTMLTREDGHQMLVYYSVGNFASTQDRVPRLLGGMAKVTIEKRIHEEGTDFTIKDYSLKPLVCHWNYGTMEFGVYWLEDYTDEMAAKHGIHRASDEAFSVQVLEDLYEQIMNTEVTPAKGKLPD